MRLSNCFPPYCRDPNLAAINYTNIVRHVHLVGVLWFHAVGGVVRASKGSHLERQGRNEGG